MSCGQEQHTRIDENFLANHNSAYATIVLTAMMVLIENSYNHLASLNSNTLNRAQEDAIYDTFSIEALQAAVMDQTAIINRIAESAITFYRLVLEIDQAGVEPFVALLRTATGWSAQMSRDHVESWMEEIEEYMVVLPPANELAEMICLLRGRLEARAVFQRAEINNQYSEDEDEEDEEEGTDKEIDEEIDQNHENSEQ